jgi:hypothetical protein
MRTLLSRISANAGSSLTAGATVLAIGVAIGAIGLTEVTLAAGKPVSPLRNGWVQVGLGVGALGAAWTLATFILAMVATKKHADFQRLLGHALNDGERLANNWGSPQEIRTWGQQTADLMRLMDRMHSMHMGAGVKLPDWAYVSDASPQSRLRPLRE